MLFAVVLPARDDRWLGEAGGTAAWYLRLVAARKHGSHWLVANPTGRLSTGYRHGHGNDRCFAHAYNATSPTQSWGQLCGGHTLRAPTYQTSTAGSSAPCTTLELHWLRCGAQLVSAPIMFASRLRGPHPACNWQYHSVIGSATVLEESICQGSANSIDHIELRRYYSPLLGAFRRCDPLPVLESNTLGVAIPGFGNQVTVHGTGLLIES